MGYDKKRIGKRKGVNPSAIVDHEVTFGTRINPHTHEPEPDVDAEGKQKVSKVELSLANGKHLIADTPEEVKDALELVGGAD